MLYVRHVLLEQEEESVYRLQPAINNDHMQQGMSVRVLAQYHARQGRSTSKADVSHTRDVATVAL